LVVGLTDIPGIKLLGSREHLMKSHLVCFTLKGKHSHDVAAALAAHHICVRAGDHCSQPLHKRLGIAGSVRVSLALYNSPEEIATLLDALRAL
jgi:cysteine desulfurase/selenocysteine lyase